jgi:hypothetical protein
MVVLAGSQVQSLAMAWNILLPLCSPLGFPFILAATAGNAELYGA